MFSRYEAHYGMPLGRKKTAKTVCICYYFLAIHCPLIHNKILQSRCKGNVQCLYEEHWESFDSNRLDLI